MNIKGGTATTPTPSLREQLMGLSDSVYIPNDTKDYTGVKIGIEVNAILDLFAAETRKVRLETERNLLSSQISRHLFMEYAEQGAIDRINEIVAELTDESEQPS
jgi:hypothetical protein